MLNTIAVFWQPYLFTVEQGGKQKGQEPLDDTFV